MSACEQDFALEFRPEKARPEERTDREEGRELRGAAELPRHGRRAALRGFAHVPKFRVLRSEVGGQHLSWTKSRTEGHTDVPERTSNSGPIQVGDKSFKTTSSLSV